MRRCLALIIFIIISCAVSASNSVNHIFSKLRNVSGLSYTPGLVMVNNASFNARAEGGMVYLNTGVLRVANIAGVAFVMAHELGHLICHHSTSTPNNEYAADKQAIKLVRLIGFNGCEAARVLIYTNPKSSSTHPSSYDRYRALGCGNF